MSETKRLLIIAGVIIVVCGVIAIVQIWMRSSG